MSNNTVTALKLIFCSHSQILILITVLNTITIQKYVYLDNFNNFFFWNLKHYFIKMRIKTTYCKLSQFKMYISTYKFKYWLCFNAKYVICQKHVSILLKKKRWVIKATIFWLVHLAVYLCVFVKVPPFLKI